MYGYLSMPKEKQENKQDDWIKKNSENDYFYFQNCLPTWQYNFDSLIWEPFILK